MAEIDYGKGIRGFLGRMPDIDYQYTPIPFQEMLALGNMSMQKDMLDQRSAQGKQQEILNLYKTISDSGKGAAPGLEDELQAEISPYLARIEEAVDATGGDLSKFDSGFGITMDFYKDLNTKRFGSLTSSGKQYQAALADAQKLNESYVSGDGGVPIQLSQFALQIGANKAQQSYDNDGVAVFSMPPLSEHIDVIPELRKHLTEMQAIGYTDESGNKVKELTPEILTNAAARFMGTDDKTRRSIMQEIDLPLQAGAIDIPQADSEEAAELLSDPRYAQVYNDTMVSMMGAPNAEQAGIAAAHRASLVDKRVNEYATSASEVFVQYDQGDKPTNAFDQPAVGQGSTLPINYVEEDVDSIKNDQESLNALIAERDIYGKDDPRYADVNRSVTNLTEVIKAKKNAVPTKVEETLRAANKNVNNVDVFAEITDDLSRNEKDIVRILAAGDESLFVPTSGQGYSSLTPVAGGSTTEMTEKTATVLRNIAEEYPEYGLNPEDITKENANKIMSAVRESRKEYKKVVESKKYEQKMKTLVPGTITIGGRDVISERGSVLTDALLDGNMQFVDITTGGDIKAVLLDKSFKPTNGYKGPDSLGGVKVTPTASFVNGKLAYKVTYNKNEANLAKGVPREATLYVTQAGFDSQAQQNEVQFLTSNLNKSNLPANRQAAAELVADKSYGAPLQRSQIEYEVVDSKGELPGYEGEVSYVERPVNGIPGISAIRKVQVSPGQYDYYILDSQRMPYATQDQSQYITSRSVIDLGRFIQEEYGKKE
jgi:hypothetical protein